MNTAIKGTKKALSLLLSLVLLLSCMPLAVSAAPNYTALSTALGKITDLAIDSARNVRGQAYDSTDRTNASDYTSRSSSGSWVVSKGGQAVWDALALYAAAAIDLYTNNRVTYSVTTPGNGNAHGDRAAAATTWYNSTTAKNFTAVKINNTIKANVTDPKGALSYFHGAFVENPNSSAEITYDLLDVPRTMRYKRTYALLGNLDSDYYNGWLQSPGSFTVLRSPLEAVQAGSNDLNSLGTSKTYDTAQELYYHHMVYQTDSWHDNASVIANVGSRMFHRFSWHALDQAPSVQFGAGVKNSSVTTAERTVTLGSAAVTAMKNWKNVNWTADINNMTYAQLLTLRNAYDTALAGLGTALFATAVGNTAERALSHDDNKGLLAHFGLKSVADGTAFRRLISAQMGARLVDDYGEYFHGPSEGKLVVSPTNVMNTAEDDDFDPRESYAGRDLAGLKSLLTEAAAKHSYLQTLSANAAERDVWDGLTAACEARGFTMSLPLQAVWLGNLKKVIYLWELYDERQKIVDFLAKTVEYHKGANNNLDPLDPEYPFADSEYAYSKLIIDTWYTEAEGYYNFVQTMKTGGYTAIVAAVLGGLDAQLTARRSQLLAEKNYREGQGYSESVWYSYRDYFAPYAAMDFNEKSSEALMALLSSTALRPSPPPKYEGVEPNYSDYKIMSNNAKTALGNALWSEIYGNYDVEVIEVIRRNIFEVLAARLTIQVSAGMKLVTAASATKDINIKKTHPRLGEITPISWETFTKIKKIVDGLNKGAAGKDIYAFLNAYPGATGYLGFEDYPGAWVVQDYIFLTGLVMDAYNTLMASPNTYWKQTALAPPHRAPRPGEDIITDPAHDYTDTGDLAALDLIKKLDGLLGTNGDLAPLLKTLNLEGDLLKTLESLKLVGPGAPAQVNLTSVVDTLMSKLLFSDEIVNAIIQMLFPMLLDQLENVFDTMLPEQIQKMKLSDMKYNMLVYTAELTKLEVRPKHLYTILNGITSAPQGTGDRISAIKIYPNHLGAAISAADFPKVNSALTNEKGYANGHNGWAEGVGSANSQSYTSWARAGGSVTKMSCYPTNAWTPERMPSLFDADGKLNLQWDINGDPVRFKKALSQVFSGLWPLLKGLLAGGGQTIKLSEGDVARADIAANIFNLSVSNRQIDLIELSVTGLDGYAQLVVPILECLLGPDAASYIPTAAAVRSYGALGNSQNAATGATNLVNAIVDPLLEYITRVKTKPITEILKLLPNLCYALSLDQVRPLLNGLAINVGVTIDAVIFEIDLKSLTFGLYDKQFYPSIADFGQAIKIPPIPFSLTSLLTGPDAVFDLGAMLTMDGVLGMVFGALGTSFDLPPFNPGRIATYGVLTSIANSRRSVSAPNRLYINANLPDVMQAFLGWLLGAGLIPMKLNSADVTEAVAAVLELVNVNPPPPGYPPPALHFGAPVQSAPKYPNWWGDTKTAAEAEADGAYIAANADVVLDVLWQALVDPNTTFSEGIVDRLEGMGADGELYADIVGTIQGFLTEGPIAEMLGQLGPLLSTQAIVGDKVLDITAALDKLRDYKIKAAGVTTVTELYEELLVFLLPAVPVLDLLMGGKSLELVDLGAPHDEGLLRALQGGLGFENAIRPILEAFTKPLGLSAVKPWAGTDKEKLEALLKPLHDIYYAITEKPVDSILSLLPTLAYFTAASGNLDAPLQQCLDVFLHPLYVLLDTIRPIVAVDLSAGNLPPGLSLSAAEGFRIDMQTLLAGYLGNINLDDFMLGTWNATQGYFVPDKPAVLFALLDAFGLLEEIEKLGMTGLTKLIQYDKYDGPRPIDYSMAAPLAAPVPAGELPNWFKPSHADFLADNADAVVRWAWAQLLNMENDAAAQPLKAWLQGLIGEDITLGDSLGDTVEGLWGNEKYVAENLLKLVELVLGLRDTLEAVEIPAIAFIGNTPMPLTEALAKLVYIQDAAGGLTALDLDAFVAEMDKIYENNADYNDIMAGLAGKEALAKRAGARAAVRAADLLPVINGKADFTALLGKLFGPLVPLLGVLLAESNALVIKDAKITSSDKAFLRVYGYNGYETGLLPALLALGAEIPGFTGTLLPYAQFKAANADAQLEAVLGPILHIVNALAADPVHTLLKVLPNAAYFISDKKGNAPLQQAIANLLHPISVLLEETGVPQLQGVLDGITGLKAGDEVNKLLNGLFRIEDLVVGTPQVFSAALPEANTLNLQKLGKDDQASYLVTDLPALLTKVLYVTGAFDKIGKSGFAGLIALLNTHDRIKPDGPGPIDYSKAPAPAVVPALAWLTDAQAKFLTQAAPGIVNWAWRELVNYENAAHEKPFKAWLEGLLGNGIQLAGTPKETVENLLGGYLYTQKNFDGMAAFILGLKDTLYGIEFQGLTLPQILEAAAMVGDDPVSVGGMFTLLEKHLDGTAVQNAQGEANFKAALVSVLKPLMPLLRVLLAGEDIKLINAPDINLGKGFMVVDGYNGYHTGLLPILLGLGAGVEGFVEGDGGGYAGLVPYSSFTGLSDDGKIDAILAPILYLLERLAADPVNTLLAIAPNLAYFAGKGAGGESLLGQALVNILHPISAVLGLLPKGLADFDPAALAGGLLDGLLKGIPFNLNDLIVGDIARFADRYEAPSDYAYLAALGKDNKASYVEADQARLLVQILLLTGALDKLDLDEDTLKAIADLLNDGLARPEGPGLVDYSKAPAPADMTEVYPAWLRKEQAQFLADNADDVLNWLWKELIFGSDAQTKLETLLGGVTLASTLEGSVNNLLGGYLYTQKNFNGLVEVFTKLKTQLDGVELGGLTLNEMLKAAVRVYDEKSGSTSALDLEALFQGFEDYAASPSPVNGEAAFKAKLTELLAPMAPLLRVFLAEGDLLFIVDPQVNGEKGLLKVFGADGYRTGLLPLLLGLGANVPNFIEGEGAYGGLLKYEDFKALDDDKLLAAVVDPILFLLNKTARSPVAMIAQLLPNAAFLLSEAGGASILQQAVNNLLHPLNRLLEGVPMLAELLAKADIDLANLDAAALVNEQLDKALKGLTLDDLVIGAGPKTFADPWNKVGKDNGAAYLEADRAGLLVQLLVRSGALDELDENTLAALVNLLNDGKEKPKGPQRIDYAQAPGKAAVNRPPWLSQAQAQFLADNADGVINWAWRELITGNAGGKAFLADIVGFPVENTLAQTVQGLLGTTLYSKKNFEKAVTFVLGFKKTLDDADVFGVKLSEILRKAVTVEGDALDLDLMFEPFVKFDEFDDITDEASFKLALNKLLTPMAPLLRVLLFESDALAVKETSINGGEAMIRIFGYDGYRSGIMPLLYGLGADIPGFTVPAYESVVTNQDVVDAIVNPLLFILDKLAQDPVNTLLQVLPNAARFISDTKGKSLLQQALDNVLYPVTAILDAIPLGEGQGSILPAQVKDIKLGELANGALAKLLAGVAFLKPFTLEDLVIGEITLLPGDLKKLGKDDKASFVDVDKTGLLVWLLRVTGAFELLESNNLTGLVNLLNTAQAGGPGALLYPAVSTNPGDKSLYSWLFWTRSKAVKMVERGPQFLEDIWKGLVGKPFGAIVQNGTIPANSFLHELLGDMLYTQENFNALLKALQDVIPEIADSELIPGRKLSDLLDSIVSVGGEDIDVLGALKSVKEFTPGGAVADKASFVKELLDFLEPLMPVLRCLLAGEDIVVLGGEPDINGGGGLLRVLGYEGYKYGLIPLYEALLVPLGAGSQVLTPEAWNGLTTDREKLEALLHPILYAADLILANPLDNLLKVLPNLAYFLADNGGGRCLAQDCIDRVLYALDNVTGSVMGSNGLFSVNVTALADELLRSLNIPGLDVGFLRELRIGTLTPYQSANGETALYVAADKNSRADLMTVVLRKVLVVLRDNGTRNRLVDLLCNELGIGSFGRWFIRLAFNIANWFNQTFSGRSFLLGKGNFLFNLMRFFMPLVIWLGNLFK